MSYLLNPRKSHRAELLAMVSHYNQATIGAPLTIANTQLAEKTIVDASTGATSVKLINSEFPTDTTVVNYFRLPLAEVVSMDEELGDFDWYAPDTWAPETSPAAAAAAIKAAAKRQNVDLDTSADTVSVTREWDETLNRFKLIVTVESFVWRESAVYVMPRHFSEEITVTNLNGLVFTPISIESVVA